MDREQEEAVQRLTARYVSELLAGSHPRLSDYLSRYPQYEDVITDFVTYYHAIEVGVPEEIDIIPPLSQASRSALDEAWKRVLNADIVAYNPLNSLQMAANQIHKSFSQLAEEVGLSQDVLKKLEQHRIDAATIPGELCHRLAKALQRPLAAVEIYLGLVKHKQLTQGVAETLATYHVEAQPGLDMHLLSFQQALEQSKNLSDEQQYVWHTILEREGLL
jgi:hypothetical protein